MPSFDSLREGRLNYSLKVGGHLTLQYGVHAQTWTAQIELTKSPE